MNTTAQMELMEAMRKQGLGRFITDEIREKKMPLSTPRSVKDETVPVKFAPSALVDEYVDAMMDQLSRIFRGGMDGLDPILTGDDEQDAELLTRYMETMFWRQIAAIHKKYAPKELKDLQKTVDKYCIAPAMFTNALNCIGEVTVHKLAITLEPDFVDDYDWKARLLTVNEFRQVAHWLKELSSFGFVTYDGFNSSTTGNIDFMLLTLVDGLIEAGLEEEATAEGIEVSDELVEERKQRRVARFTLGSTRAVSNVVALYRYFFYSERIKYITDQRNVYTYSTFEEQEKLTRYFVQKMVWDGKYPEFLVTSEEGKFTGAAEKPTETKKQKGALGTGKDVESDEIVTTTDMDGDKE